ncbi:MAG: hypothetical protein K6C37_05230 [Bacteroidales bacterium]|nr:hypothetical protein [Bacteroidales bacterium]MDT3357550.1 hypothetical protein [Bacteroidota bacterium]
MTGSIFSAYSDVIEGCGIVYGPDAIKTFLPHREPMLLVEKMWLDEDGTGHSEYTVKDDDFFVRGYAPDNKTVPFNILCEIMAQGCAIVVKDKLAQGYMPLFAGIEHIEFINPVKAGDLCECEGRIIGERAGIYIAETTLTVGEKICCAGQIMLALVPAAN